ncbi:MAG: hypothetical protein ACM3L8_01360 [Verrucomicrobiota bacterium]
MRSSRARWIPFVVLIAALALSACGSTDNGPSFSTAAILSDQPSDGDIAFDPVFNSYTVTNGPATLYFGIDSLSASHTEYRAFLDFPLDGSTSQPVIPIGANIVSAWVTVHVVSAQFSQTIPTLMELVIYPIGGNLAPADYNSLPLTFPDGTDAARGFDLYVSDVGRDVAIEVTSLMQEVQRRGLADFQVRLLLDFVPGAAGFVEVDDRPDVSITAPLLTVQYN